MTENKAIDEIIKEVCSGCYGSDEEPHRCSTCGFKMAKDALSEIQQYRAIGTVESLKNLPAICDSLAESGMKAEKLIEELKAYRAIGTVEELKTMKENGAFTGVELAQILAMQMELKKYQSIGTIEEFNALKEKSVAKKAYYKKMVYPRHKWMEEDGKIDAFAYSSGYCNGPMCERCYYSFCEHCNPDGWEEECVVEDYICPSCGEKINRKKTHCKCGQKLDWSE